MDNNYPLVQKLDTEEKIDALTGSELNDKNFSIFVYTNDSSLFRISFFVSWMQIQFKISRIAGAEGIYVRYKFGSSAAPDWTKIS